MDEKFNSSEEVLEIGQEKNLLPSHTWSYPWINLHLFGSGWEENPFAQDLHGPLLPEFGSNLEDYGRSTKKLLELNADILCEGHFGTYKTKKEVRNYILSYRRQYGVE